MKGLPLFDAAAARDARDAGIERVTVGRDTWLEDVRRWALNRISESGSITSDDVRRAWKLPDGAHYNLWGAVFNDARFRPVGHAHSKIRQGHGNKIRVWGRA
jgi:hypothetical protein